MDADNLDTPITVTTRTVACDGGGGALGHPRVFLTFDEEGRIMCPYCSRSFVLDSGVREAAGH